MSPTGPPAATRPRTDAEFRRIGAADSWVGCRTMSQWVEAGIWLAISLAAYFLIEDDLLFAGYLVLAVLVILALDYRKKRRRTT